MNSRKSKFEDASGKNLEALIRRQKASIRRFEQEKRDAEKRGDQNHFNWCEGMIAGIELSINLIEDRFTAIQ